MPGRNRIPIEHRERIVRAFEDKAEDYLLVADTFGINRSTARGIVTRYIREERITPFPVHYEKIRIHLRELTTNSAKMLS